MHQSVALYADIDYTVVAARSTEEIFALFISMTFAVDAFRDVVFGKSYRLGHVTYFKQHATTNF